jgi:hypothetical protein
VKSRCFETFPFPDLDKSDPLKARLRELGEQLDAHRKKQQAAHPELTMTGMYNVLEKLRREEPLTNKEKKIHDEIDAATFEAYGWDDLGRDACPQASAHAAVSPEPSTETKPSSPSRTCEGTRPYQGKPLADRLAQGDETLEQDILQRLVDLNHERAAEEAKGKIRYLRPEYQDPDYQVPGDREQESGKQSELDVETSQVSGLNPPPSAKQSWPKDLPSQVAALRTLLPETGPAPAALAAHFGKRSKKRVQEIDQILETLRNLGQL